MLYDHSCACVYFDVTMFAAANAIMHHHTKYIENFSNIIQI